MVLLCACLLICTACTAIEEQPNILTTTTPIYTFTQALCEDTPLHVTQLVQENISCLHDYTLTVKHMKSLESADVLIISGGGFESFLDGAVPANVPIIDASAGIGLNPSEHCDDHQPEHHHDVDPHYWLSPENAKQMAHTICVELKKQYPQYADNFAQNLVLLDDSFDKLQKYADSKLSNLKCTKLITFHDGFSYMAESFSLTILKSIEEESGSEASAKDLINICELVTQNDLPAIFAENNGSTGSAEVICRETGAKLYYLDMGITSEDYFDTMYHNIKTLKEALG